MQKLLLITLMLLTAPLSQAAQKCNANAVRVAPDTRYTLLNSNTEVEDVKTGLIWQRCSVGQSWNGSTCSGVATSMNWTNALQTAKNMGNDWRLPNIRELGSLVEPTCSSPTINETFFPATVIRITDGLYFYWSSSSEAKQGSVARYFDFSFSGNDSTSSKSFLGFVRLVRSRQ